MKALIFGGGGRIGSAAAWDLARYGDCDAVGIVARNAKSLNAVRTWINSDRVVPHILDIADREASRRLMREYDVAVLALPDRRSSYQTLETAIEAGTSAVDVLEEYHRRPEPYETEGLTAQRNMTLEEYGESLHRRALDNEVTVLDGMGFAPGLANVTLAEGIRKVGADRAVARVGGIPTPEAASRHPLQYMITWSFSHVLREYMVKVRVIADGAIKEVDATSGRESFRFSECGQDEILECAITPGMPSFLYTMPNLKSFSEKTIRWPGHFQAIDTLKECGLLDLESFDFKGRSIRPREVLLSLLEPRLKPLPGDRDLCVMWNTASGIEKRADYFMWAEADLARGISAMARVTGFTAALGARMLAEGRVRVKGIAAPEEAISGTLYQRLISGLSERGIAVVEQMRST
jgi:lysine 6-dehydrogenase